MRFYRYIIYKLYGWGKRRPNDTPVANVILTLSFVHFIQMFTIYLVLLKFVPQIDVFNNNVKGLYLYMIGALFILLNYFLLYNKKRWNSYEKEFGGESKHESRKGKFYVLGYLIGSILLFFVILVIMSM